MNIVVINGTMVKGCTYNIKEIFLSELNFLAHLYVFTYLWWFLFSEILSLHLFFKGVKYFK